MKIANLIKLASILVLLNGCAEDVYSPYDYGYHYSDTTVLGIMYRVDGAGAYLDPDRVDYSYTSTLNCVGAEPVPVVVVSTDADANPEQEWQLEGWSWPPHLQNPALVVVNTVQLPSEVYRMLQHELIHVFTGVYSHNHEAFERCDEWRMW